MLDFQYSCANLHRYAHNDASTDPFNLIFHSSLPFAAALKDDLLFSHKMSTSIHFPSSLQNQPYSNCQLLPLVHKRIIKHPFFSFFWGGGGTFSASMCHSYSSTHWRGNNKMRMGNTLNVISSASSASYACHMSASMEWLCMIFLISWMMQLCAASIPSVLCTSTIWLLSVVHRSINSPSIPITSSRPVLQYKKHAWTREVFFFNLLFLNTASFIWPSKKNGWKARNPSLVLKQLNLSGRNSFYRNCCTNWKRREMICRYCMKWKLVKITEMLSFSPPKTLIHSSLDISLATIGNSMKPNISHALQFILFCLVVFFCFFFFFKKSGWGLPFVERVQNKWCITHNYKLDANQTAQNCNYKGHFPHQLLN